MNLLFFIPQTTPPHTPHSYPVCPATPAGKYPPVNRLCSVCRSQSAGLVEIKPCILWLSRSCANTGREKINTDRINVFFI